jgi:hypothetical protein
MEKMVGSRETPRNYPLSRLVNAFEIPSVGIELIWGKV